MSLNKITAYQVINSMLHETVGMIPAEKRRSIIEEINNAGGGKKYSMKLVNELNDKGVEFFATNDNEDLAFHVLKTYLTESAAGVERVERRAVKLISKRGIPRTFVKKGGVWVDKATGQPASKTATQAIEKELRKTNPQKVTGNTHKPNKAANTVAKKGIGDELANECKRLGITQKEVNGYKKLLQSKIGRASCRERV